MPLIRVLQAGAGKESLIKEPLAQGQRQEQGAYLALLPS